MHTEKETLISRVTNKMIIRIFCFIFFITLIGCGGGTSSSSSTHPTPASSGIATDVTGTWMKTGSSHLLTFIQSGLTISSGTDNTCSTCTITGSISGSNVTIYEIDNVCIPARTLIITGTVTDSNFTAVMYAPSSGIPGQIGYCPAAPSTNVIFTKQ